MNSQEFRSSSGIYISCNQIDSIDEILANRTNPDIDLIVVSDGQGILGIGDQGIGGLMIAVSKLAVYSVFGAINPLRTLPIILDVGTDNQHLIDDPLYLGVRSPRIEQDKYDSFIEQFVKSVKKNFPRAFLHWEDFGRNNAERILEKYQYQLCNFNDDSQGTGVVALGSILSGLQNQGRELKKSKIVIFGAGTAGIGIAKHIVASLVSMGLDKEQAYASIYLIDKDGLITDKSQDVTDQQRLFAKKMSACNLDEVISATRANILIGTSAAKGSFKQSTIKAMLLNDPRPMILILSNPSGRMEADPSDVIKWSNGSAQVACGSPYQNVVYNGQSIKIAQCNNFLSFPGIGMATVVVKPKYITTEMLLEASMTLSRLAQSQNSLLPDLSNYKSITINVAVSVARKAIEQGIATIDDFPDDLQSHVEKMIWRAEYMHYRAI